MQKSCATDPYRMILLLPFGYAYLSRYHWPRDFLVNALTAWVPGIILAAMLGSLPWLQATLFFFLGYTAFICLYEVGYLANDTVGLRHDPTPRRRIDIVPSPGFVAIFITIRVGVFLAACLALGVAGSGLYWTAVAALVVTLIAHNTLCAIELKAYTFLQLSLLRFSLPILPALIPWAPGEAIPTALVTGLLVFSLPRFLTYLDAKGRLTLPERKARSYHLKAHVAVLPLIALLSIVAATVAPIACLVWALTVQVIYVAGSARGWRGKDLSSA